MNNVASDTNNKRNKSVFKKINLILTVFRSTEQRSFSPQ